ncbi:MAG TPA: DUF4249 domain-containing protein [Chryseolinea sp.]|nr:DUF4249 domain-containing protein [Chryseolinea sp.]
MGVTVQSTTFQRIACRRAVYWMLFACLLSACLEPYVPSIAKEDFGILVVDGFFVPNDSTQIRLSRTVTIDNPANSRNEPDAIVAIEGDNGYSRTLIHKTGNIYVAPPVNVDPNAHYRLHIRTADKHEYYSEFIDVKPSPSLDSIRWTEVTDEHDVINFNIFSHDPSNSTHYYLWTYDETWEYSALDISVYYIENDVIKIRNVATDLYYCWRTLYNQNVNLASTVALSQDVVYDYPLLQIPQTSRKLLYGYSILVKQYALTEDAYNYWSVTKKNSEDVGTLFDPLPSQPQGNLYCATDPTRPAIGFFSASTVQQQRIFLKRQQIKGPGELYEPSNYDNCFSEVVPLEKMTSAYLQGKLIQDRVFDKVTFELIGYKVYPADCLDCRLRGGVNTPPSYWK